MSLPSFRKLGVEVTPQLRSFLRAEFAQILHYEALDGEIWTPHKIENAVRSDKDISGSLDAGTIERFLDERSETLTRRRSLETIAKFLLAFGFIYERDLKHYGHPVYERAASALTELYRQSAQPLRTDAATGVYRCYVRQGRNHIAELIITLASPDAGQSLVADLAITLFRSDEPEYMVEESDNFSPSKFPLLRDLLDECAPEIEATGTGPAILHKAASFATFGGDHTAIHTLVNAQRLHWQGNVLIGMQVRLTPDHDEIRDGLPEEPDLGTIAVLDNAALFQPLTFYPQGIEVQQVAEFDPLRQHPSNVGQKGSGLAFQGAARSAPQMSDKDQDTLRIEQYELDVENRLAECANETERLEVAMNLWRADHAKTAVENGADGNAMHHRRDIPLVHYAALFGMRGVLTAMIENGVDLTVRDKFGRLPSACAEMGSRNAELRDMLAAAQGEQFREKGIDPKPPHEPENC